MEADTISTSPVREGDILAGKYRIERVLGVGGMGVVVAALHLQLDQRVAIKFLLPDAVANRDVVSRFAREARAAAKIQSEHVARVIDVGTLETGSPYMVMEYLEGRDLSAVVEQGGAIAIADAAAYVLQACEAIAEAHAAGIVHRDLKPSNLFLANRAGRPPIVKVLDFGISKMGEQPGEAALTRTSAMLGSPMYMSPEQMKATKGVDARSDIWAIGVILFELVTGTRPFDADTIAGIIACIIADAPPPLREVKPDAPPEFEAIILRCLEKKADKRYQNVAELAIALAPFAPAAQRHTIDRVSRVLGMETPISAAAGSSTAPVHGDSATIPGVGLPPAGAPIARTEVQTAQQPLAGVTEQSEVARTVPGTAGGTTAATWANTGAREAVPVWKKPWVAVAAGLVVLSAGVAGGILAFGKRGEADKPATASSVPAGDGLAPAATAPLPPPDPHPIPTSHREPAEPATAPATASSAPAVTSAPTAPPSQATTKPVARGTATGAAQATVTVTTAKAQPTHVPTTATTTGPSPLNVPMKQ